MNQRCISRTQSTIKVIDSIDFILKRRTREENAKKKFINFEAAPWEWEHVVERIEESYRIISFIFRIKRLFNKTIVAYSTYTVLYIL